MERCQRTYDPHMGTNAQSQCSLQSRAILPQRGVQESSPSAQKVPWGPIPIHCCSSKSFTFPLWTPDPGGSVIILLLLSQSGGQAWLSSPRPWTHHCPPSPPNLQTWAGRSASRPTLGEGAEGRGKQVPASLGPQSSASPPAFPPAFKG